ncbi:MAG: cold-shock protein [Stellaceae bacterium]
MAVGSVKWFNPSKGYGFIRPDDGGADIFVHVTVVQRAGMEALMEGQRISYEVVHDRGKLAAANLSSAE